MTPLMNNASADVGLSEWRSRGIIEGLDPAASTTHPPLIQRHTFKHSKISRFGELAEWLDALNEPGQGGICHTLDASLKRDLRRAVAMSSEASHPPAAC